MVYSIGEIAMAEKHREQCQAMMREAAQRRRIAITIGTEKEKKLAKMEYAELKREFRKARDRALYFKDKLKGAS